MYPKSEFFLHLDEAVRYLIWGPFLNGFCLNLILPAALTLLALALMNRLGRGYGLAQFFWLRGRHPVQQVVIGVAVASVVWQSLLAGYVTDPFATNYTIDREDFVAIEWDGVPLFPEGPATILPLVTYVVVIFLCSLLAGYTILTMVRLSQLVSRVERTVTNWGLVAAAVAVGVLGGLAIFPLGIAMWVGTVAGALGLLETGRAVSVEYTPNRRIAWYRLFVALVLTLGCGAWVVTHWGDDADAHGKFAPALYPLAGLIALIVWVAVLYARLRRRDEAEEREHQFQIQQFPAAESRDTEKPKRPRRSSYLWTGIALGMVAFACTAWGLLAWESSELNGGVAAPYDPEAEPADLPPLTWVGQRMVWLGGWGDFMKRAELNEAKGRIRAFQESDRKDRWERQTRAIRDGLAGVPDEPDRTVQEVADRLRRMADDAEGFDGRDREEILAAIEILENIPQDDRPFNRAEYAEGRRLREAKDEYVANNFAEYFPVYGLFFLGAALSISPLLIGLRMRWDDYAPAIAIVVLLHLAIAFYVSVYNFFATPQLWLFLPLLVMILGGIPRYKLWFPGLDRHYPDDKRRSLVKHYATVATDPKPLPAPERVPRLLGDDGNPGADLTAPAGKPKMAIVCVSGGGSRAAAWTMKVLTELEKAFADEDIAFPYSIRLMTGASGGMIAGAYYVATLDKPDPGSPASVKRLAGRIGEGDPLDGLNVNIRTNWLNPVVQRMATWDLISLFAPARFFLSDRGRVIERTWEDRLRGGLTPKFSELREGEMAGWRPSLIFSPMIVEDGRSLLVSNLALGEVIQKRGSRVGNDADGLLSREAIELFRLFPGEQENFAVSTAARMSASFPVIMPAVELPTEPPRRVVDAGYSDNYGVGIAAAWLFHYREWVRQNTSGVVMIQIRDGVSEPGRKMDPESIDLVNDPPGVAERGLQWISSPLSGLLNARVGTTTFRNDNLLYLLGHTFADAPGFFTTAAFEFSAGSRVALGFSLTEQEQERIDLAGRRDMNPAFDQEITALLDWWRGRETS